MIDFLRNCPFCIFTGALLVIINFPIGWISFAWFAYTAKKTGNTFFYYAGICSYIFSWALLFFGIFLCGKDYAKTVYVKYQIPVFIITAIAVASIAAAGAYFAKKPSKINAKAA